MKETLVAILLASSAGFVTPDGKLTCEVFKYPERCTPAERRAFEAQRDARRYFLRCNGSWEIVGKTERAVIARCGPKKIRL